MKTLRFDRYIRFRSPRSIPTRQRASRVKPSRPILAWHMLPSSGTLRYGDGRIPRVGQVLSMRVGGRDPEFPDITAPRLCHRGMHACPTPIGTLCYSQSWMLCRVVLDGRTQSDGLKLAADRRTILQVVDVRKVVREFYRRLDPSVHRALDPRTAILDHALIRCISDIQLFTPEYAPAHAKRDRMKARLLRELNAAFEAAFNPVLPRRRSR